MITLRDATVDDAERILEIYSYYVENTAITFEYDTPSLDEFKERIRKTKERYPYLVVMDDGEIKGYTYAGPFVNRAAYDRSCEVTIYVERNAGKRGLGRKLYEALEHELKNMGITNMYARIGYPDKCDEYLTTNSADFHEHLGFEKVAEFHKCGYKFDRWYNVICVEKIIGEHSSKQCQTVEYSNRQEVPENKK